MGGYYVEAEEEEAKNIIDRSKTHMIFGLRCREKILQISITPGAAESSVDDENNTAATKTVVGLVPVNDDAVQQEGGFPLSFDDENVDGNGGRTLSRLMNLLFDADGGGDGDEEKSWTLVEIGADPLFSLAAAEWMESRSTDNKQARVIVRHPDEQRLRVLEHAHLYFNKRRPKSTSPLTFATSPLTGNDDLWTELQKDTTPGTTAVVVVTSADMFAIRPLGEINEKAPLYQIIVPSTILGKEQLKDSFEYRSLGFGDGDGDDDGLDFLEIIPSRQ